jgi:MFS family permease
MKPNPDDPLETSLTYPGWRVVLAAFFGVLAGFGSLVFYGFSLFIKPLHAEFGWTREAIAGAFGSSSLCIALFSPPLGRLLDRYGPRRVILPCVAIFGLAYASLSLLTAHLWQLYAVFILLGIVGNASGQMGYSRAVSTWFDRRRGFALALLMAGTGIGAILVPIAAQAVIMNYGWRPAYAVLGISSLLLGLPLTACFVKERPARLANLEVTLHAGVTMFKSMRTKAFWILIATLFISAICVNGTITHLAALLSDRGIPPGSAAMALSSLGIAGLSGRLVTGYLLDRFFGPRVAFVLLCICSIGILLLTRATTLPAAILAAACIGFGMGGESDVTPYLLTRYFGMRSFSSLYGFTWTAYAAATALASVFMGKFFDLTGSYQGALVPLAVPACIAGVLMLFMPAYTAYQESTVNDAPPLPENCLALPE